MGWVWRQKFRPDGSPAERRVPELIPVLGSQPAGEHGWCRNRPVLDRRPRTGPLFSALVYRIAAERHVVSAINEPQMDLLIRSQRSTAHPGLSSAADSPSLTDDFDIKLLSRFSSNDARRPIQLLCGRREE